MSKKAVIFDMDGVIVDSEPIYMQIFYELFKAHKQDVTLDDIYTVIGTSTEKTWEILGNFWDPVLDMDTISNHYHEFEPTLEFVYEDLIFPHMRYLLKRLKEEDILIGLASASSRVTIDNVITDTKIKDAFHSTISGDEVPASKPSPDVYLETMKRLGVKPENTIVIEDSPSGIKAGKSAGATVIAIKDHRFGLDQSQADHHVKDLMEAYNLIMTLFEI